MNSLRTRFTTACTSMGDTTTPHSNPRMTGSDRVAEDVSKRRSTRTIRADRAFHWRFAPVGARSARRSGPIPTLMLAREPVATTSAERAVPTRNFRNVFACRQGSVLAHGRATSDTGGTRVSIGETVTSQEDSLLWTLEEIGRLISESGNPSETLTNIVQPDPAAVRDRRLLGLPARAGSRQPGAGGDDRPAARERRPRADAPDRGPGRAGRRAAAAAVSSPTRRRIRASSTSARPARIRTARSSACRSSIAGCCRACWSCRRSSRASSARTTSACW